MLGIIFWIVFGMLIGWIAAILQDKSQPVGTPFALTITGAIGGLAGGVIGLMVNGDIIDHDAGADGLLFAILGAIAFIYVAATAAKHNTE